MIVRTEADRANAHKAVDTLQLPFILNTSPPRASDELTARMHCAIRCVAQQVMWAGEYLSEEDWKRLFVAGLYGQKVLPSPCGTSFVVLDRRTSRMSGPQKHDLTESVYQFGAERGVIFNEPGDI